MDLTELDFSSDEDIDEEQPLNLIDSKYLLSKQAQTGKKLSILSMNTQSINNKLQKLGTLRTPANPQ